MLLGCAFLQEIYVSVETSICQCHAVNVLPSVVTLFSISVEKWRIPQKFHISDRSITI
jgi:hypothetical protein